MPARFGEQYSDNTYILLTGGANNYNEQITNYFIETSNGIINSIWDNCYKAIFICNNVIYQLETTSVEIEKSKIDRMKGQAILIRALTYFNMVRAWGNVPYIDKKISPAESYDFIRVDKEMIYQNLIDDLNYCKEVLPESWIGNDIGRVTKYAAAAVSRKSLSNYW